MIYFLSKPVTGYTLLSNTFFSRILYLPLKVLMQNFDAFVSFFFYFFTLKESLTWCTLYAKHAQTFTISPNCFKRWNGVALDIAFLFQNYWKPSSDCEGGSLPVGLSFIFCHAHNIGVMMSLGEGPLKPCLIKNRVAQKYFKLPHCYRTTREGASQDLLIFEHQVTPFFIPSLNVPPDKPLQKHSQ